jgi:hypothetical protein
MKYTAIVELSEYVEVSADTREEADEKICAAALQIGRSPANWNIEVVKVEE